MSSCAKRTRKEKYELLTKATKLELQFFVCLADLHFQISYINAIILPTWNNNYLASVCTCIYMIKSETFLFFLCMFHIQLLPWHHSIPCTFGDIWTLSCETLYPLISGWKYWENLSHPNTRNESMDFFQSCFSWEKFLDQMLGVWHYIYVLFTKDDLKLPLCTFFVVICLIKFCNFAFWGLW